MFQARFNPIKLLELACAAIYEHVGFDCPKRSYYALSDTTDCYWAIHNNMLRYAPTDDFKMIGIGAECDVKVDNFFNGEQYTLVISGNMNYILANRKMVRVDVAFYDKDDEEDDDFGLSQNE